MSDVGFLDPLHLYVTGKGSSGAKIITILTYYKITNYFPTRNYNNLLVKKKDLSDVGLHIQ